MIERILVPTDFSERAARALALALDLARRLRAEVVLLHVVTPLETDLWGPVVDGSDDLAREATPRPVHDLMRDLVAEHDTTGVPVALKTRRAGVAAPAVVACAEACGAGLVVMGTHGRRGIRRALLGSVAEEVVRRAPCPVLLVRDGTERAGTGTVRRVLVPLDHTPASRRALPWAERLTRAWGATLGLLHVVDVFPPPGLYGALADGTYSEGAADVASDAAALVKEELQALADEIGAAGLAVTSDVEIGSPAAGVVNFASAHDVDLIVMTSRARSGLSRLVLGSVTEKVLHAAPCPVLIVRTSGAAPVEARPAAAEEGSA